MIIKFSSTHRQKFKYQYKRRVSKKFKVFQNPFFYSKKIKLVAYRTVNLFFFHIKSTINYLSKILSLRAKLSRKMRFRKKKLNESFQKNDLIFSNANKIFTYSSQKNFKIKSYYLIKNKIPKYLLINLPKVPLSRKPLNMRMGKGKGGVKSWFVRVNPGVLFLTINASKLRKNIFIVKSLFKILPLAFSSNNHGVLSKPSVKFNFINWKY